MYSGDDFILKILYGNEWLTLGGMQVTKFEIRRDKINTSDLCNNSWQELNPNGMQYVNVNVSGVCSNSLAEFKLFKLALNGLLATYRLVFAGNIALQGDFQVLNYERNGFIDDEERYSIMLCSSGVVNQILISAS